MSSNSLMETEESNLESWIQDLTKKIIQKSTKKIAEWCGIVTKLGLDREKQTEWANIFELQIDELYNDMIQDAATKQTEIINNIEELLQKAVAYCKVLEVKLPDYEEQRLGLYAITELLKEEINKYEAMIAVRKEEFNKLSAREAQLCHSLGWKQRVLNYSIIPNSTEMSEFAMYVDNLEDQKFNRDEQFSTLQCEIHALVEELKYTPTLDFEQLVCSPNDKTFLVTNENMKQLSAFHQNLVQDVEKTKEAIKQLREMIRSLWEILDEDLQKCNDFMQKNQGNSLETLQALKLELQRCQDLKMANIEVFVKKLREDLLIWWDRCHFNEEQREKFRYFHSILFTEDLLSFHDIELNKIKTFYDQNSKVFQLLEKRQGLWDRKIKLEDCQGYDRFKNRGGQLLQEEKERNIVTRNLSKVEDQIVDLLVAYEAQHQTPFLTWGRPVKDILLEAHEQREQDKKLKSAKKKQQVLTPQIPKTNVSRNLLRSPKDILAAKLTLSVAKLQTTSKLTANTPRNKENSKPQIVNGIRTAPAKILLNSKNIQRAKRSMERKKRIKHYRRASNLTEQKLKNSSKTIDSSIRSDYKAFEDVLSHEDMSSCRSTLFPINVEDRSPLAIPLCRTPNQEQPASKTPRTKTFSKSPRTATKLSTAKQLKMQF